MAPSSSQWEIFNRTDAKIHIIQGLKKFSFDPGTQTFCPETGFRSFPRKLAIVPEDESELFTIRRHSRLPRSAQWEQLKVESASRGRSHWRVYHMSLPHTADRLMVIPNRLMASWLGELPDKLHLSDILTPGTHGSMARYWWPFAQCQNRSQTVLNQLEAGVRVLDVRLGIKDGTLVSYHDFVPEETPFLEIVATLRSFLRSEAGKNEFVVMSIKQEDFAKHSSVLFSKLVHDQVVASNFDEEVPRPNSPRPEAEKASLPPHTFAATANGLWYLHNRVPYLGEVRGKIVLFSRFGGDGAGWEGGLDGMGIHPTVWPDSPNYVWNWDCGGTTFQQEDWYDIGCFTRVPDKVTLTTATLEKPQSSPTASSRILPVAFSSAYSLPWALPSMVALGVGVSKVGFVGANARIGHWALDVLGGGVSAIPGFEPKTKNAIRPKDEGTDHLRSGWLLMDYFDEPAGIIPLLVEINFIQQRDGIFSTDLAAGCILPKTVGR